MDPYHEGKDHILQQRRSTESAYKSQGIQKMIKYLSTNRSLRNLLMQSENLRENERAHMKDSTCENYIKKLKLHTGYKKDKINIPESIANLDEIKEFVKRKSVDP